MAESTNQQPAEESQPASAANQFQQAAEEQQPGLVAEFIDFLNESRAWWLTPIVIVLAIVGVLVFLSGTVVAPFIYPIF